MNPFLLAYIFVALCALAYLMRAFLKFWNEGEVNISVAGVGRIQLGWVMFTQLVGQAVVWPLHILTWALGKMARPGDRTDFNFSHKQTFDKDGRETTEKKPKHVLDESNMDDLPEALGPEEMREQMRSTVQRVREMLQREFPMTEGSGRRDMSSVAVAHGLLTASWVYMQVAHKLRGFPPERARTTFLGAADVVCRERPLEQSES